MRGEVLRRGVAVGVVLGLAAAAETLRTTSALRLGPWLPAFELTALFVLCFGAIGLAIGLLCSAVPRLGGARVLWPLTVLAIAFAAWNEGARHVALLDTWRYAARVAIGLGAIAVVAYGWRRTAATSRRLRSVEACLAGLLLPAAIGALLYASRPLPAPGDAATAGGVLALAPRFAPEPEAALAIAHDAQRPRVLLIGVDGLSWDRLERGIAAGRLPTFAKLIAQGVAAPLRSERPTYSPRLWTSMLTGVPAEQHGIEDFYLLQVPRLGVQNLRMQRSFGPMRLLLERSGELRFVPVTSSLRRRKALWNLADEAGLRSAVVGLWATWPPEALRHGAVVSDHASVARQREWLDRGKASESAEVTTWPPALAERLAPLQRTPDSVTRAELEEFVSVDDAAWDAFQSLTHFSKQERLSAFRSSHLNDAFYARAAATLWSEDRPDLLVVYLRAVDELSHFFLEAGVPEASELGWSDADVRRFGGVVDAAHAWTDRAIAPLVATALADGDTLVALVSDHGWSREASGRWNHNDAPPGVLVLAGAGVCESGCAPLDASIYDVAPTLLARLGLPLSDELVGRPLDAAFETPRPVRRVAAYGAPLAASRAVASGADGALREKLEALGYVRE
jgi:hypothetical protein